MVAVLGYSKEQIKEAVKDMYKIVATRPDSPLHFPIGRDAAEKAGYDKDLLTGLPDSATESFAGVGNPFRAEVIKRGMTVLDVGAGSGTDVAIAANIVGVEGKVWALDVTPEMREKLSDMVEREGLDQIESLSGDAEAIPLPDNSVDVVTSNGVLNLVPEKRKAVAEIFRVLKPGGKVQIADIVIASPVTPDCEDDPKLWAECVVGATVDENYLHMFRDAGFENVEILRDYDYFAHSPSADTREVARQFGAHALELRMTRGATAPMKLLQLAKRADPRRLLADVRRRGLWGFVALSMALLACYGTLALVGVLSMLGAGMALNNGVWAAAILLCALLATVVIGIGIKKHRSKTPLAIAIFATGLLTYTMLVDYRLLLEIVAFAGLGIATWLDYHKRRWAPVVQRGHRHAAAT